MLVPSGNFHRFQIIQFRLHCGSRGIAPGRFALHSVEDDFLELRANLRINLPWSDWGASYAGIHNDERVWPFKRYPTGWHFVRNPTTAIRIGSFVASSSLPFFGLHLV